MADVRMLHLGSSVLLSGVNAFPEPQECGAWGAGSRRGQEGAGSAQSGAAPCCPPCSPCRAPIGLLGSTMVIYGLARGGPAPWHPVCLSWQLAQPCLAPPAAIFKAPGLHPKYSALYFWCKMIFLGRGCGDFFCMKLVGLETGRERETAGREAGEKAGRAVGREGLVQRESSVLQSSLPMVCSWIRNQQGLGLVYSWGLLRTLEGFAFV